MKLWRLFVLLLALFAAVPASARAIYEWVNVDSSTSIISAIGAIEMPDAAFATGVWHDYDGHPNPYRDPNDDFYFSFASNIIGPLGGIGWSRTGVETSHPWQFVSWQIDVGVLDSLLTGYINIDSGDADASLQMSSDANGLWTIGLVAGPDLICANFPCHGATGYWVRVPEPPALLLLGIGLLALIAGRRRKT